MEWGALPKIIRNSIGLRRTYSPSNSQRGSRLGIVTLKNKKTKRRDGKTREGLGIPKEGRRQMQKDPTGTGYAQENMPDSPQPKKQDWKSPVGLGKGQTVRIAGRVPLEHHPPF